MCKHIISFNKTIIRNKQHHTLILGMGIFANNWWKGKPRMGKNRSRTFPRWHTVRTFVNCSAWSTSGQETTIFTACVSSRTKGRARMSKYIGYSWWCHFLRLGHSFGWPIHAANCAQIHFVSSLFNMIHLAIINIMYNTFYKFNCIYENYMVLQEVVKTLTVKRNYKIQYEISYS